MKLIIVRHGEAHSKEEDPERSLTEQGRADVARMSRLIRATGWTVADILTSPVLRARQSAQIISRNLGGPRERVEERLSPGIDPDDAIDLLGAESHSNAAIWVFHAPCVSRLASFLTGLPESGLYFPAGGMLALNLSLPRPEGRAVLCWAMQPEFVGKLLPE